MLRVCFLVARSFAANAGFDASLVPLACVHAFPGDQQKATRAWIRLECLALLVEDPRMRDWHLEGTGEAGALHLSEHVLHAAAIEPVLSDDPEGRAPYFDPDSFFARVADLAGRAGTG
ncbi:MAG: hypothetical protein IRY94_10005 [Rhodospirillaceae bacterium]|nr:hypothetical protein [Rhodospirillaceae bacterium]